MIAASVERFLKLDDHHQSHEKSLDYVCLTFVDTPGKRLNKKSSSQIDFSFGPLHLYRNLEAEDPVADISLPLK